jgi:hypothetical protein
MLLPSSPLLGEAQKRGQKAKQAISVKAKPTNENARSEVRHETKRTDEVIGRRKSTDYLKQV